MRRIGLTILALASLAAILRANEADAQEQKSAERPVDDNVKSSQQKPQNPFAKPTEPASQPTRKRYKILASALNPKPLPVETEAVVAAIADHGSVQYNAHGRVWRVDCEDATDADIKLFAALPDLECLYIGPLIREPFEGPTRRSNVSDAGLAPLLKASKLRKLSLTNTQVTDAGVSTIGRMTKLIWLGLASEGITGESMGYLDGLDHLQSLDLIGSRVGDDGMRDIGKHTTLLSLCLGRRVTPRGLAELAPLTSLEYLRVYGGFKDADLVPVGRLTSLQTLRLGLLDVTDEGLSHMRNMKQLRSLSLADSPRVTDAGMVYVGEMTGLERLVLNSAIGDAGIARLTTLTKLRILVLHCTKVTDASLAKLTSLEQLRELNLSGTRVSAAGVRKLRGMKHLEKVNLDFTKISQREVGELERNGVPATKIYETYPIPIEPTGRR